MMNKLTNLEDVNALALPAKVLVLLSKYAQELQATNRTVIKLSSLRVFMHVHQTCLKAETPKLNKIYHELLDEVNQHLEAGTMYTNKEKKVLLGENKKKQKALKKYLAKKNIENSFKDKTESQPII